MAAYREFCARESWPPERLAEHSARLLRDTLQHAASQVPYYRALGVGSELSSFPVLSKTAIQDNPQSLKAAGPAEPGEWLCGTSGSSGHRVYLLVDRAERLSRLGSSLRGDYWGSAGRPLAPGCRYVKLWGVPTGNPLRNAVSNSARSLLTGQTSFAALQMDHAQIRRIHACLQRERPPIISGFTSTLSAFALACSELGLPPLSCDKLIVTAENLDPQSRERIGAILRGPLMQRYGCREAGDIAHQCEAGSWHVNSDHLQLEVLREDGSIARQGSGSLLITKLANRRMPIVRYELGDWATLAAPDTRCPCGRGLPLLIELSGRTTSMLRLPSGRLASGHLGSLVAWGRPLRQWQIERLDATQATYRCVPLPGFSEEHEQAMRADLARLFHGELSWTVERCESIAPAASGKYMPVLSRVD